MGLLDKRYNTSTSSGGNSRPFNLDKYDGVKFWKQKEGPNKINILPYEITSKLHPLVAKGKMDIGDMDYTLEINVHTYIGPNNETVVCPKWNYNKPCPICEEAAKLKEQGKEKAAKALYTKRKLYYNIQDVNNPDDGVQIFEANHKYFEKPLMSLARDTDDGSPYIDFADIKHGKVLKFTGEKEQFDGKDFIQFANLRFIDREESVKSLATSVFPLDAMLRVLSYEEIQAVLMGGSADDDEDEDEYRPSKKNAHRDDDDDDGPPAKKATPKDDEDDDPPPVKKEADTKKCQYGHTWGKDNDEFPECDKCSDYKACLKAQMAM